VDIQHLVDRLEDLIDEGRHIPFSKYTMIDEERALEIIDQMRISIPEEIEKATKVLAKRENVLAQANEEAARVLSQAREQSAQVVDQEVTVQQARARAQQILEIAKQEAANITAEADNYVADVLARLEQTLQKSLREVRNGLDAVNQPTDAPQAVSVTAPIVAARPSAPAVAPSAVPVAAELRRQTVDAGDGRNK
jgi:vacuolar-type H+-ATPase subunit H